MQKEKKKIQHERRVEELLNKLFLGDDIPESELDDIRKWLIEDGNDALFGDEFRGHFLSSFKYEENPVYAKEMWPDMVNRLGLGTSTEDNKPDELDLIVKAVRMPLRKRTAFKVAAVLLPFLFLGASLALLVNKTGDTTKGFATVTETPTVSITADIAQEFTLPDGSTIDVKPGSVVSYPENFDDSREVFLDGEAFFSVTHIDGKPFRVKSNSITVTVHGTEFHVKAYDDDDTAEVKLASGSVAVNGEGIDETFMTPGQHFVFDKTENTILLDEIAEGELYRLRGLNLSLDGHTLDEVFRLMSQYFGTKIIAPAGLDLSEKIGTNFDDEVSLDEALTVLQMISSTPFDYTIESDTVRITRRK